MDENEDDDVSTAGDFQAPSWDWGACQVCGSEGVRVWGRGRATLHVPICEFGRNGIGWEIDGIGQNG